MIVPFGFHFFGCFGQSWLVHLHTNPSPLYLEALQNMLPENTVMFCNSALKCDDLGIPCPFFRAFGSLPFWFFSQCLSVHFVGRLVDDYKPGSRQYYLQNYNLQVCHCDWCHFHFVAQKVHSLPHLNSCLQYSCTFLYGHGKVSTPTQTLILTLKSQPEP